jgi:ankyrin repeat protein
MTQEQAAVHYISAVSELDNEDRSDDEGDGESQAFLPPAVSLPAVENGGYDEDAEGDNKTPETKLLAAAGDSDTKRLQKLLESGINVHHSDESGQTALHLAADKGSVECLKILLQHGGNPNASDQDGISVLQTAVIAGHTETCRFLLEHGADPDQEDADGDTPRSCAADDGPPEMKLLFNLGADN